MRKTLILGLAMAAATLSAVPTAQAQMAPGGSSADHRMDGDHRRDGHRNDGDQRADHRAGPDHRPAANHQATADHRGPQVMIPREWSLRLRTETNDLNNRILRAQQSRRITLAQANGLRTDIRQVQHNFWGKMEGGMTRREYDSVNGSITRVRTQLESMVARNARRRG